MSAADVRCLIGVYAASPHATPCSNQQSDEKCPVALNNGRDQFRALDRLTSTAYSGKFAGSPKKRTNRLGLPTGAMMLTVQEVR